MRACNNYYERVGKAYLIRLKITANKPQLRRVLLYFAG